MITDECQTSGFDLPTVMVFLPQEGKKKKNRPRFQTCESPPSLLITCLSVNSGILLSDGIFHTE